MRLIDCYAELITYTAYLTENIQTQQLPFDEVSSKYQELLSRAEENGRREEFSDHERNEALFAVCAWIDESILCSGWPERPKWMPQQLQRVYFNTTRAGEEFFTRLAALDESAKSVREVYDYCLALGFKGRFFRPEDEGTLDQIEYKNLSLITDNPVLPIPDAIFPDAYGKPGAKGIRGIGFSLITVLIMTAPVVLFLLLYLFYNNMLENLILSYFK
jgi:type VI secretion system protein ImpK